MVACGEDLDGGAACPLLCPGQSVVVFDTILEAIALDTTLVGFPPLGLEPSLTLVSRGDTVDVGSVVRFDVLPTTYLSATGDSSITAVDSAYVLFAVNQVGTLVRAPLRIDVYDVDTVAADTSLAAIRALFRADRLIGGTAFDSAQVRDSIKVYLNNAPLLAKIRAGARLRLGFRASSPSGGQVDLGSVDGGQSPILRFDPKPSDTLVTALTVTPRSLTPPNEPQLQLDLADYAVVMAAPPSPTDGTLAVGGFPARRAYLRFNVPARILDSSTVLRATLLLTQRPNPRVAARDTVPIVAQIVRAGVDVVDIARSAILLDPFALDTLRVAPGDGGATQLEVAGALRQWTDLEVFRSQRALVLRSTLEGVSPFEAHFYSLEAPTALRPRLRINYALRTTFGIP